MGAVHSGLSVFLIGRYLKKQYPQTIAQVLKKRWLGPVTWNNLDSTTLELLRKALKDPHPEAVIYAIGQLELVSPAFLIEALPELLTHPSRNVKLDILNRIEHSRLTTALPFVSAYLKMVSG